MRDNLSVESAFNKLTGIDNIILFTTIYFVICMMVPAINVNMPRVLRLGLMILTIAAFYLSIFIKYPKLASKIFIVTFIFLVFNIIVYYSQWRNYTDFYTKNYYLFLFWYPLAQAFYYSEIKDVKRLKLMIGVIMFAMVITSITTLIGLYIFPNASRELAAPDPLGSVSRYTYYNIGGYGFIYSIVMIIPYVAYIIKNTNIKLVKLTLFFILLLFYACVIKSQYTTALLLGFLIILPIFFKKLSNRKIIFLLSLNVFIVLFLKDSIVNSLLRLSIFFRKNHQLILATRLKELYFVFSQNEMVGGVLNRSILYRKSLNSFLENPFTGNLFLLRKNEIGRHSEILDLLGSSGLLGFSLFLILLVIFIKLLLKYNNKIEFFILFSFLLLGSVNTLFSSPQISTVVFLFTSCIEYLLYLQDKLNINEKDGLNFQIYR